ncbi:c-type cytochrome domain-containing protein [Oligoflexus tunisiensis]|uniref:c-type cytochrome domain-containing protein n=1 Tax=Oligoflexus tunisiensis TaxID=708132 RepID=UPI00159F04F2|nr:c-type cytochrome domain-containing protein [Oligoflexus tunisiensis]
MNTSTNADGTAKPNAPGEEGAAPAGDLSLQEQATAILTRSCAKCHTGATPQGNFGIIDNVAALLDSGRYIIPGNPEASLIFTKLAPFGNMPPTGALKTEEVDIIKQWIQSLESNQVVALRDTQVLDLIQKDIQSSVAVADQPQVRYFTLHVPNNVGATAEDLEAMRKGFFKVINSLSRSPVIVKPVAVDAKKLIYRVKLDEMGIPINVFESVMSDFYPFSQQYLNNVSDAVSILASQNDSSLRAATLSNNYLIRADWFMATATLPIPYERLLQLGANQAALDQQLGVNTLANINANRVQRAGFRNSGMSTQNRVIERHAQLNGLSYWTSYDFSSSADAANVFSNPLGPVTLNGTREFTHEGAGIIFQLANGMFAYRVVSNAGVALDKAPTSTVSQSGAPTEFLAAMVNGVSCMGCHNAGLIYKKDEIRLFAQTNVGDFTQAEFEKILNIYPEERIFKETIDRDNAFYFNAMSQLGIDPKKPDPVNQSYRFYNRSLTKKDVAEELGITTAVLDGLLANEPFKSRWNTLRNGGAISREDLSVLLAQAIEQTRIEVDVTLPALGDFVVTTACMFASQVQMDNCVVAP